MDWLRRNWPDLLIGVALVAVIAGIIATLISGGSFFPVGQGDRGTSTPPATTAPATTTPPSVGTTQPDARQDTASGGAEPAQTEPGAAEASAAQSGAPLTGQESGPADGIAVLPPAGSEPADTQASTQTATPAAPSAAEPAESGGGVTALPPAGEPEASSSAPAASTPSTPAGSQPSAPATASASAEEPSYRVGVGAFGNADNAQRLAQQFQAAGYPVLLGEQGDLTIVLVGPYATEAEARRVADQVRAGNFGVPDPTVYLYQPDDATAATSAASAPAAPAAAEPATSAAPAPAASGGRYLQVGAYATRESSLPQRARLEGMGFTVAEVQEGNFLKLLVGPYSGSDLSDAQSRLAAEGIENFARGL